MDDDGELHPEDAELAAAVYEDVRAFLAGGMALSRDARLACYQRALALALELRSALGDPPGGPSAVAMLQRRECDLESLAKVLGRFRQAARMALADPGRAVPRPLETGRPAGRRSGSRQ